MQRDTYLTIKTPAGPEIFKDRKSKFLGYAFPFENTDVLKPIIEALKKEHHNARHWCYAYRLGITKFDERANDDGEPSNSAGNPILGQIKAKDLTNILVVVVRYFGGVKLGVGGLMNAYKTAAQLVLDEAEIIEEIRMKYLSISFKYKDMNKVMRIIKAHQLHIHKQKLAAQGEIVLAIRLNDFDAIKQQFDQIHTLRVEIL